jgi:exodeoxyribonuclease VII large subunit
MEVRPVGAGALQKALDELKRKLEAEGLFRPERKRALPRFPERIGLITSPDAAARTDVLRVLKNRWGGLRITFFPVAVQGIGAAHQIVRALREAHKLNLDAIILTRGGGSLEDLQSFNDEGVARAIFGSSVPVVTGVGHERDWTIADLVADVRAATPSNAAELSVPDRRDIAVSIEALLESMQSTFDHRLLARQADLDSMLGALLRSIEDRASRLRHGLDQFLRLPLILRQRLLNRRSELSSGLELLSRGMKNVQSRTEERLREQLHLLHTLSPQATLNRGYSITHEAGKARPLRIARPLKPGTEITTRLASGTLSSTVTNIQP